MNKPRLLFIDVSNPKTYDGNVLRSEGLGGTEATCVRIAEGLVARGYPVTVSQHNREQDSIVQGVLYNALKGKKTLADVVVVLRQPKMMEFIYGHYKGAKRMLWLHDLNLKDVAYDPDLHKVGKLDILCVSDWHAQCTSDAILSVRPDIRDVRVRAVKNPVGDSLVPDDTIVDPFKLVFFSSPHKGLDRALHLFACLRRIDSRFTLHIANPGYYPDSTTVADGVTILGTLSHAEALQHVRSALAVFHCNSVFPETFGLVYAEAHAVGTPAITANVGAVREILTPQEMIDVRDEKSSVEKVLSWNRGERPRVRLHDHLRLSAVLARWEEVIRAG